MSDSDDMLRSELIVGRDINYKPIHAQNNTSKFIPPWQHTPKKILVCNQKAPWCKTGATGKMRPYSGALVQPEVAPKSTDNAPIYCTHTHRDLC